MICLEQVKYPAQIWLKIFHRTFAINCQIELVYQCKKSSIEILFYHKKIDHSAIKNERRTRISMQANHQLEPDACFMLVTPECNKLYLLEFEYKDTFQKSYERFKYILELSIKKQLHKKYNHPKVIAVCSFIITKS